MNTQLNHIIAQQHHADRLRLAEHERSARGSSARGQTTRSRRRRIRGWLGRVRAKELGHQLTSEGSRAT